MNSREIRSRLKDAGLPTVVVDIFTSYENDLRFLKKEVAKQEIIMREMAKTIKMLADGMGGMSRAVEPLLASTYSREREMKRNDIVYSEPIDVVGDPKNNE